MNSPPVSTTPQPVPGAVGQDFPAPLSERLRNVRKAAIFTHLRPDPDALGSQASAACLLARLGAQEIHLMQFAEIPAPYRFLMQDVPGKIATLSAEWEGNVGGTLDTILVVDTCTYQQLEPAQSFLTAQHAKVVGIDHHVSRENIGPAQFLYADTKAAACVEIIYDLAKALGVTMDQQIALPLMAGLVGDTGWFRFDSVTPRTHLMAAELVRHVNPAQLYKQLMQNETKPKLGLMQRALAGARWAFEDRFAAMLLRHQDFVETGATQNQTEYLVDMPMMVKPVEVVALMSEMADGRIRVSLRSKRGVDVNHICNQFGGGGHAKAAGCRLDGPLEQAYTRLAAEVQKALHT